MPVKAELQVVPNLKLFLEKRSFKKYSFTLCSIIYILKRL